MNTKDMTQEQISALADGELSSAYVDMAMAALRQTEGRNTWDVYHQIGDVMRSDEMALTMSPDFFTRMSARLEAEPTIVAAPLAATMQPSEHLAVGGGQSIGVGVTSVRHSVRHSIKRFALPGMAAAAVAAAAFIITPQATVVSGPAPNGASTSQLALASASAVSDDHARAGEVLRDPQMDEYLVAHQRFSPSLYSAAQYARPATFAPDANN